MANDLVRAEQVPDEQRNSVKPRSNAGNGVPRVVRNGQVAVVYSPDFGTGWTTEGFYGKEDERLRRLYCPSIVYAIEDGDGTYEERNNAAREAALREFKADPFIVNRNDFAVRWIPLGVAFRVDVYDGSEGIEEFDASTYDVA